MSNYRLIVCIDIEADSLKEAYVAMRDNMIIGDAPACRGWETSDEWYGPEGEDGNDTGEAGDPAKLQEAIVESMRDKGLLKK